jgi:hypothetical protein
MAIPDLLTQHIEQLRQKGYTINVIEEGQEIGIIFVKFPIPESIWNRTVVDLLVVAHLAYPNSKLDMFWVDPTIALKNGNTPKATTNANRFGRAWQQFSWHVNSWNPGHDNLITYLDVVNDRLRRAE